MDAGLQRDLFLPRLPDPCCVSDSLIREERKQHATRFLPRVPDRSEVKDNGRTALRSQAGRLIDSQGGRKVFAGGSAQDNERQCESQRPASRRARDHALGFQSHNNARRTPNRRCLQVACMTTPSAILCTAARDQSEPYSSRRGA